MLDFPKQSLKHNRQEFDLADASAEEYEDYPSLEDITVEGVPYVWKCCRWSSRTWVNTNS